MQSEGVVDEVLVETLWAEETIYSVYGIGDDRHFVLKPIGCYSYNRKKPLTFIGTIYTSIAPADGIEQ